MRRPMVCNNSPTPTARIRHERHSTDKLSKKVAGTTNRGISHFAIRNRRSRPENGHRSGDEDGSQGRIVSRTTNRSARPEFRQRTGRSYHTPTIRRLQFGVPSGADYTHPDCFRPPRLAVSEPTDPFSKQGFVARTAPSRRRAGAVQLKSKKC